MPTTLLCQGCQQEFSSRNLVFKHLKDTQGACLSAEEYQHFCRNVLNKQEERVIVLFGYITSTSLDDPGDVTKTNNKHDDIILIRNGTDAANLLLDAVLSVAKREQEQRPKYLRSYGHLARSTTLVAQDNGTGGAITELLVAKLPLVPDRSLNQWINDVNQRLDQMLTNPKSSSSTLLAMVRVLGRQAIPGASFNAEVDISHRRVEYLLPLDFLYSPPKKEDDDDVVVGGDNSLEAFFHRFPCFSDSQVLEPTTSSNDNPEQEISGNNGQRPDPSTLEFLYRLKTIMKSLVTRQVAIEKKDKKTMKSEEENGGEVADADNDCLLTNENNVTAVAQVKNVLEALVEANPTECARVSPIADRVTNPLANEQRSMNQHCRDQRKDRGNKKATAKKKENTDGTLKITNVLRVKRKRYHNFTPSVMAHEFLSYRRLDRLYHRATLRFQQEVEHHQRPFMVLSLTGDMFLTGQVSRVIGLLIALARNVIDPEFVDCVFDEKYTNLVPTPPAPLMGMYARDVFYTSWEGKADAILTPRPCNRYSKGWNDAETLRRVKEWQHLVREHVGKQWLVKGTDPQTGVLCEEKLWTEHVLLPWAVQAKRHLEEYRKWKEDTAAARDDLDVALSAEILTQTPISHNIDSTVPALYEKVLALLRAADRSGRWPSTTLKRQLVMVSTGADNEGVGKKSGDQGTSLFVAHIKAKSNKESRSSAYAFKEGVGGASGSFSVGAMPGERIQPKANEMFPELMKAAFELEIALCPHREPSSTIAINRNAQFRPHTDSGAGAGQSTSLIVGLGNYAGGELVVEGIKKNIRYKPVEFNGWKQRHWTMPFLGERFSLVWFTPKGCEGVRGIDLCR